MRVVRYTICDESQPRYLNIINPNLEELNKVHTDFFYNKRILGYLSEVLLSISVKDGRPKYKT